MIADAESVWLFSPWKGEVYYRVNWYGQRNVTDCFECAESMNSGCHKCLKQCSSCTFETVYKTPLYHHYSHRHMDKSGIHSRLAVVIEDDTHILFQCTNRQCGYKTWKSLKMASHLSSSSLECRSCKTYNIEGRHPCLVSHLKSNSGCVGFSKNIQNLKHEVVGHDATFKEPGNNNEDDEGYLTEYSQDHGKLCDKRCQLSSRQLKSHARKRQQMLENYWKGKSVKKQRMSTASASLTEEVDGGSNPEVKKEMEEKHFNSMKEQNTDFTETDSIAYNCDEIFNCSNFKSGKTSGEIDNSEKHFRAYEEIKTEPEINSAKETSSHGITQSVGSASALVFPEIYAVQTKSLSQTTTYTETDNISSNPVTIGFSRSTTYTETDDISSSPVTIVVKSLGSRNSQNQRSRNSQNQRSRNSQNPRSKNSQNQIPTVAYPVACSPTIKEKISQKILSTARKDNVLTRSRHRRGRRRKLKNDGKSCRVRLILPKMEKEKDDSSSLDKDSLTESMPFRNSQDQAAEPLTTVSQSKWRLSTEATDPAQKFPPGTLPIQTMLSMKDGKFQITLKLAPNQPSSNEGHLQKMVMVPVVPSKRTTTLQKAVQNFNRPANVISNTLLQLPLHHNVLPYQTGRITPVLPTLYQLTQLSDMPNQNYAGNQTLFQSAQTVVSNITDDISYCSDESCHLQNNDSSSCKSQLETEDVEGVQMKTEHSDQDMNRIDTENIKAEVEDEPCMDSNLDTLTPEQHIGSKPVPQFFIVNTEICSEENISENEPFNGLVTDCSDISANIKADRNDDEHTMSMGFVGDSRDHRY